MVMLAFDPRRPESDGQIDVDDNQAVTLDSDLPGEATGRHLHGWPGNAQFRLPVHVSEAPAEEQAVLLGHERVLALAPEEKT